MAPAAASNIGLLKFGLTSLLLLGFANSFYFDKLVFLNLEIKWTFVLLFGVRALCLAEIRRWPNDHRTLTEELDAA